MYEKIIDPIITDKKTVETEILLFKALTIKTKNNISTKDSNILLEMMPLSLKFKYPAVTNPRIPMPIILIDFIIS